MKNFFGEFKKFITRGNVIDLAVGVIVGGAFTAIVNALSNSILKPLINYFLALLLGKDTLSELFTYLPTPVFAADGTIDLAQSIYIDWGAFINAVINFVITAFVLFCIVKIMNHVKDKQAAIADGIEKGTLSREERKELKENGIKIRDKAAVKAYFAEKAAKEAAEKAKAEEEERAAAEAERLANPTTEDLLKQIRDLLESK